MCELVLFIISVLQGDEYAQVVRSSDNAHTCASELCAQLIIPSRTDAFFGTVDVKGRNWRVMGSLLCKVRHCDCFAVAGHAVGAAGGR